MDELCPLCLKMGEHRRIKAVQINLEEALWMCENDECPWPFLGNDEPTVISRKVGEKWGYEWETYRRVTERIGSVPVSMELSLYTPPVTPSGDGATKDSVQAETTKNNPNSNGNPTDFFLSDSSSGDSYAPTTAPALSNPVEARTDEAAITAKSMVLRYKKDSKMNDVVPSFSRPSIFDIDGDKIVDNKIKIEPRCVLKSSDLVEYVGKTLSATVPNTLVEKIPKIKKEIPESGKHIVSHSKKITPQIRSISKANVDLQIFDSKNFVKSEKTKPMEVVDSATLTKRKLPNEIDSVTLTKRKSPIKIVDSTPDSKHTTTITLDGIVPITLSYDLAALEEPCVKNTAITSGTPISREKNISAALPNNEHDKKLAKIIPKTPAPVAKRRQISKTFQKFSFNVLRKTGTTSKTADDTRVIKTETLNPPEIDNCNEIGQKRDDYNCSAKNPVASHDSAITSRCETINLSQTSKTVNSFNPDANNSVANLAPDGLNVNSLLEDILLDGYQNATQDLDDAWLTSFFNENT